MSRRGLLLGGSSAEWKISCAPYPSVTKVTLTVGAGKRLPPPPSCHLGHKAHTWHFSSHETERLFWLLPRPKGWWYLTHQIYIMRASGLHGCVSLVGLIYNTVSDLFFWWMANRTAMEFLFVEHRLLGVSLQRSPTVNQACTPHALMMWMCDCCMTNQHFPLSNHSRPRPVRAPPSGSDASLLSPNFC